MIFDNAPRDIKIDKTNKDKFRFFAHKFDKDEKEIFLLAMKVGLFYDTRIPIKEVQSLAQLSTFSKDDTENMMIIAFSEIKDMNKIFNGKEVIKICEEYANGGIRKLYKLFVEEGANKDDTRIIEDIIERIKLSME